MQSQPEHRVPVVSRVRRILDAIEKTTGVHVGLLDAEGHPAEFDAHGAFRAASNSSVLSAELLGQVRTEPSPILHSEASGACGISVPFLSGGHIGGFVTGAGFFLGSLDSAQTEAVKKRVILDGSLTQQPHSDARMNLDYGKFCVLADLLEAAAARIGLFVGPSSRDGSLHAVFGPLSSEILSTVGNLPPGASFRHDQDADVTVRERLEALYNSTQEAILMLDKDLKIVAANKELASVFGIAADAFIGVNADWLQRWIIKNAKDPARVSATVEHLLGNPGATVEDEIEFLSPRYMILRFYSAPVTDKNGEHIGRILVFRDITKFRKARYDLIGSEKAILINRVAAGMAHELNNILAGMVTYADYALEDGDPDKIREALKMSISSAEKANELIQEFLAVAGPSESQRQNVEIHLELERLLDSLEPSYRADNIRIHRLLEAVPRVNADPVQMQQAFRHILDNAREAIGRDGTISVRTETDWDGGHVRVVITDSGPGIPVEYLDRIFDPFFTTKGVVAGGGSTGSKGLGLSIAKGIVDAHGGKVYAGNVLPRGASLIVELPLSNTDRHSPSSPSGY